MKISREVKKIKLKKHTFLINPFIKYCDKMMSLLHSFLSNGFIPLVLTLLSKIIEEIFFLNIEKICYLNRPYFWIEIK